MKKYKIFNLIIFTLLICVIILLAYKMCLPYKNPLLANAKINDTTITNDNIVSLNDNFEDDNLIVVLDSSVSEVNKVHNPKFFNGIEIDYINDLTANTNLLNIKELEFKQILQIYLKNKSKENVVNAIKILKKMQSVISAEPNYLFKPALLANDTYFASNELWGLNGEYGINAPEAWNITTGSKNVRVGILDTGIANHTDLNANLTNGWDFFNDNSITSDDTHSHGTLVAGIIGAVGNNNLGVVGVNWNVTLVPMQASNQVYELADDEVIKAIQWAKNKWGTSEQIDIINFSVAGFGQRTAVLEAIRGYKGLFVWGAGNNETGYGLNIDNFADAYEFKLPNLISVGSIGEYGNKSYFSYYGKETVDLFAPGESIYSTTLNNKYTNQYSGTSFATAYVSGVAALIYAKYPFLSASEVKDAILNNVDKLDNLEGLCVTGGKLNAYKALSNAHTKHTAWYHFINKDEHEVRCAYCPYTIRIEKHSFVAYNPKTRFAVIPDALICTGCNCILYRDGKIQITYGLEDDVA